MEERLSQALGAWQTFNWLFQPGPVTFDTNTQIPSDRVVEGHRAIYAPPTHERRRLRRHRYCRPWKAGGGVAAKRAATQFCAHAPRNQVHEHAPLVLMGRLAALPGL